jgi:acylphosphatase
MKHVNIIIKGKVQGVFFRASAKEEALRIGVSGFVCNRDDGDVYAEIEGDPALLDAFIRWCHHGPTHASVTSVNVSAGDMKNFIGFEIRRSQYPY